MTEQDFLELISGRGGTVRQRIMRLLLHGLSYGYAVGVSIRNRLFDMGLRRSFAMPVPVVSVGNLTTGGTGKTPVVALLVEFLVAEGRRPGIVSRGYRSSESGANDEFDVLRLLCPNTPHVQNPDRVAAVKELLERYECDVIVADDAFQHRRLKRDLDIVLIDGLNPFGPGWLLPRGLLREPVRSIRRADLIALTRADQCSETDRNRILTTLRRWTEQTPIDITFRPGSLLSIDGTRKSAAECHQPVLAFCGIGNPAAFVQTLADAGIRVCREIRFPDHHHYRDADLRHISDAARAAGTNQCVTTLKDLVKLRRLSPLDCEVAALEIRAQVTAGLPELMQHLQRLPVPKGCPRKTAVAQPVGAQEKPPD